MQFAARQHGLQQVAGVHRAFGLPRPDHRMQLVDKQDDAPSADCTSFSTAFRRSSNSPRNFAPAISAPMSSETTSLFFQPFGHVAAHDALREPSTMAVLPTPGSPISTGLFFVRRKTLESRGEFLRRGRSPDRACPFGELRSDRGRISPALRRWLPDSAWSRADDPRTSSRAFIKRSRSSQTRAISCRRRPGSSATASNKCSMETYSSLSRLACSSAAVKSCERRLVIYT
jgi:hypothetical protein